MRRESDDMLILAWFGFGILTWLILGLLAIRVASRAGHMWGYSCKNPLLCRLAIIFQGPPLILECAVMDWIRPEKDRLASGAARLMWAKFKDPRLDVDALKRRDRRRIE
jgi:hypothetical protein